MAQSQQKDVPLQVKAIGNIEAYTSVAIKSQVSGQISRIHFQEGSDVEKGALLISIDPEPFQATLSQCEAALAKDQAQAKFAIDGLVVHDDSDGLSADRGHRPDQRRH